MEKDSATSEDNNNGSDDGEEGIDVSTSYFYKSAIVKDIMHTA